MPSLENWDGGLKSLLWLANSPHTPKCPKHVRVHELICMYVSITPVGLNYDIFCPGQFHVPVSAEEVLHLLSVHV